MNNVVFSNLIWKFSERMLAQVISFIVSVILARLLLPEQFGLVALVMVFINIVNTIVISGFNSALIQNKNSDNIDFSSVFWLCFLISIIAYIIVWFAVLPIAEFYNNKLIIPVFRVLSIKLILSSINTVQHAYVARNLQFRKYFWSTLWGTIISAVVGIYLAIKGYGVWALVSQYLTNSIIDTIVLYNTIDWHISFQFSFIRVKKLFSYGWKIFVDSMFGMIQNNLRNLIVGKVYSSSELAYYTKSQHIPNIFVSNIAMSISSVLLPVMSNKNDDDKVIIKYISMASKMTTYIIYPLLVGIIMVSSEFVDVVLTKKWLPMVPYLRIYCIICMIKVLMTPRNEALKAIGRSDIFLIENVVFRIIDIALILIFVRTSPILLMVTWLFGYTFLLIIIIVNANIYNKYGIINQIKDIKNTLFVCLIMSLAVYFISFLRINILFMLILKVIIGIAVYIFVSFVFNFEEYTYLKCLLRQYVIKKCLNKLNGEKK